MKKRVLLLLLFFLFCASSNVLAGSLNVEGLDGVIILNPVDSTSPKQKNRQDGLSTTIIEASLTMIDNIYFRIDIDCLLENWGYSSIDLSKVTIKLKWIDTYEIEGVLNYHDLIYLDVYKNISVRASFWIPYEVALSGKGDLKANKAASP